MIRSIEEFESQQSTSIKFNLKNDKDSADVVLLLQKYSDLKVIDIHYVQFPDYRGYVKCLDDNCPLCKVGKELRSRIFIPIYDIQSNTVKFWDRPVAFADELKKQVFNNYANPSEVVYTITRNGEKGNFETSYTFVAVSMNDVIDINNVSINYDAALKVYTEAELSSIINSLMNKANKPPVEPPLEPPISTWIPNEFVNSQANEVTQPITNTPNNNFNFQNNSAAESSNNSGGVLF